MCFRRLSEDDGLRVSEFFSRKITRAPKTYYLAPLRYLAFFFAPASLRALNFSTRPAVSSTLSLPV